MNILYLCDEYPPGRHGGIGNAVRLLARQMVKQGNKVIVAGFYDWGYGGEDMYNDEGVLVYRFRRKLAFPFFKHQDSIIIRGIYRAFKITGIWHWDIKHSLNAYAAFLEELIKKHQVDIVEMPDYNDYMRFCNSYIPFPKLSVPVVVKMHGCMTYISTENKEAVPDHIRAMEADVLNQASAVCSVSKYNATKTAEYLNYKRNVTVLYNGIEEPAGINRSEIKKDKQVIFTGTLTENKGIYQLMAAWNIVNSKVPSAQLYIYGKGPIDKVRAHLNTAAGETVFFRGHVSRQELFSHLSTARVAVFPSIAESFSLAPMEAMICGAAVVFTKRTSGPELIQDGVNGLLTDPYSPSEIAEKIHYLLNNESRCEEMAKAGQLMIRAHFTIKQVGEKNYSFYQSVLKPGI